MSPRCTGSEKKARPDGQALKFLFQSALASLGKTKGKNMRINFNLFGFEVQIERMGYDIHIIGFEDVRNRYVERFTVIHHTFTLRGALRTARRFAREYALEDECSQFIKIYREEERE